MRASDLPTPGILSNGQSLRHAAAHAISRAQINGEHSPDTALALKQFFEACAAAVAYMVEQPEEPTPVPSTEHLWIGDVQ